jgi:hypothetical protein
MSPTNKLSLNFATLPPPRVCINFEFDPVHPSQSYWTDTDRRTGRNYEVLRLTLEHAY